MKRDLTNTEKRISEKMVKKLVRKKQHSLYLIKYTELMLTEGLFRNYQAKMDEFERNKKELYEEVQSLSLNINELNDQITNGVVIKDKKRIDKKTAPVGVG